MTNHISIIIVDDSESDAMLIKREIWKDWPEGECAWISMAEDLKRVLSEKTWNIVISDIRMPELQVLDVISMTHAHNPDLPIIVVSGLVSAEDAVDLLKSGAHDYVRKDDLARLNPAIKRELEDSENRRARKQAMERLEFLISSSPAVIYTSKLEGDYAATFVSDNVRSQLGYDPGDFLDDPGFWISHVHPDDRPAILADLENITERDHNLCEYRFLKKDGSYRWMRDESLVKRKPDGSPDGLVGCWADITERKQAEEALRQSEEKFSKAFQANPSVVVISGLEDGRLMNVNDAFVQATGYSRDEVIGKTVSDINLWANPERRNQLLDEIKANGSARNFEMDFKTKSGEVRNAICAFEPIEIEDQRCFLSATLDVTDRINTEKALRQSELRNRAIVESAMDAVVLADRDSVILEFNPAAEKIFGFKSEDAIGKTIPELLIPERHRERHRHGMEQYVRTGKANILGKHMTLTGLCADGLEIPVELTIAAIELPEGPLFAGIIRDLTEKRTAEESLKKSSEKVHRSLLSTIQVLGRTIEQRDPYTAGHQSRVSELAVAIAHRMGLAEEVILGVEMGALIHDIGKIHIPGEILTRPGKFSDEEFSLIKTHCQVGYDIVKDVELPWPVGEMILQHHERINGTGYPQGLRGGEICIESRIIGVADVVEAITAHRPYRPALGIDVALGEIRNNCGKTYDPKVAEACLELFGEKGDGFHFSNSV